MATVKFTQVIRYEVINKIDSAYQARLTAKQNEISSLITADLILDFYIKMSGGYELYESCKHWLKEDSTIRVTSINGVSLTENYYYFRKDGTTFNKPIPNIPYPYKINDPSLQPIADKYVALREEFKTLRNESVVQKNNICAAFEAYGSVNTAIKEHPELANMLSKNTLDKINTKKERVKASEVEITVDAGMINTIAVLSKFAEAT
jgi:F0F1-type ATP synthase delta subunit